jgi:hypothetical protein
MQATCVVAFLLMLQSADVMQKALTAESKKLASWASEKVVVEAVKRQNAKSVPIAEVKRIDAEWTAGKADAQVRETTTGACAERLRALAAADARYGETFVTDANGAIVCATQRTSDYWQGDESKWTRAFEHGVFIDRPKLDESAKARLAQISLPVTENGKTIGVLTVGVNVDKLK